jgi:hypothetical protein
MKNDSYSLNFVSNALLINFIQHALHNKCSLLVPIGSSDCGFNIHWVHVIYQEKNLLQVVLMITVVQPMISNLTKPFTFMTNIHMSIISYELKFI